MPIINKEKSFSHFILTRFNVPTKGKESKIRGNPAWLPYRFQLFEEYCLPSIRNQTNKNFTWLIFFDDQTPSQYKERIQSYNFSNLKPIFLDSWNFSHVETAIKKHSQNSATHLLTTRLDNDDSLNPNYIDFIQKSIGKKAFYNFPSGIILNAQKTYKIHHNSNAFMSRMESINHFKTVWDVQHQLVSKSEETIQLSLPNAWIQVVHDTNVSNKTRGTLTDPRKALAQYDFITGLPTPSRGVLALDRLIFSPFRTLRDTTINIIKQCLSK